VARERQDSGKTETRQRHEGRKREARQIDFIRKKNMHPRREPGSPCQDRDKIDADRGKYKTEARQRRERGKGSKRGKRQAV
jgi:hypothetical protein